MTWPKEAPLHPCATSKANHMGEWGPAKAHRDRRVPQNKANAAPQSGGSLLASRW